MGKWYVFVGAFIILISVGCKSKVIIENNTPIPERSIDELTKALSDHNYDYKWFSGEASIKVKSPQESIKGKTFIRIRKDSVMWAVVKKIGVEGGRVLVTPNLYATINRIEGTYSRGKTDEVLSQMGLGFDYYDIQEAIFGNVLLPDSFEVSKTKNSYILQSRIAPFDIRYSIDGHDLNVVEVHMTDNNNRSITVYFDDYRDQQGYTTFAYNRSYIINDPKVGETKIDLKFKKVELDKKKNTKFTIPPHYEEVN